MFGLSVTVAGVEGPLVTVHKVVLQVVHGTGLVGPQVIGYCTQSVTVADVHVVGPQVTVHKVSLWQMWWAHRLLYTKCHCGRSTGTGLLYTKGREEVVNY